MKTRSRKPETSITDSINEEILASTKRLTDSFKVEKDAKIRLRIQYAIAKRGARVAIRRVARLSERDWRRYMKEQFKPFAESVDKTSKELFEQKLRLGQIGPQDLEIISEEKSLLDRFNLLTPADSKLFRNRRTIDRILVMNFLQYVTQLHLQWVLNMELEPFQQLNAIVHRRFGALYYWSIAVGLLATHENLVKKKLVELGMGERDLQVLSRTKGFRSLIDQLVTLVERKEKRKVSFAFYRTSSLRTLRDRLEHEGYKLNVTRDDVFELLKDTLRFETELFPIPQNDHKTNP